MVIWSWKSKKMRNREREGGILSGTPFFFGPLQLSDRWLAPRRRTRGRKEPQSLQPKEFVNIHRKHSNINYSQRSKFME